MRCLLGVLTGSLLLLLRLVLDGEDGSPLLGNPLGTALAHGLVAETAGLHLVGKVLGPELLGLGLVDVLHEDTLVLEHVTLRLQVELVVPGVRKKSWKRYVQMLVDLASLTVLPEQATQNTLAAHPLDLGRETSLGGTLTLTVTGVTADTLGGVQVTGALARVRHKRLLDDLAILDELADIGTRVGVRNVGLLGRVEPDLALADTKDGRSQTPLNTKIDHGCYVLAMSKGNNLNTHLDLVSCWFGVRSKDSCRHRRLAQKLSGAADGKQLPYWLFATCHASNWRQ